MPAPHPGDTLPPTLTRGAYAAPFLDADTGRRVYALIDRRGRCVHQLVCEAGEAHPAAVQRALALLELLDPPARGVAL